MGLWTYKFDNGLAYVGGVGPFPYKIGDVFCVEIRGKQVRYFQNEQLIHTVQLTLWRRFKQRIQEWLNM